MLHENKIALLFPGSGSHYLGMGKTFYNNWGIVKKTFEEANDVLGMQFEELCFNGSIRELNQIDKMLPALFIVSIACFRVYMQEIGVAPEFAAGHSLGEYSALTSSGVVSFAEMLKTVCLRSQLAMEVADGEKGTMTIVNGIERDTVENICRQVNVMGNNVNVACYNSLTQVLISGHEEAVRKVEDQVLDRGANIINLIGSAPYHSVLMEPVVERLRQVLLQCRYNSFKWPVISNVYSLPYKEGMDNIINNLTLQMVKPVQWEATIDYLKENGITMAIEIGPQSVLKQLTSKVKVYSIDIKRDFDEIGNLLTARGKKDWQASKKQATFIGRCLAHAAATPNINYDEQEYEAGVIIPYENMLRIQRKVVQGGIQPTIEEMYCALEMLSLIFKTKKTPIKEQVRRFNQIFDETDTRDLLSFPIPSLKGVS